MAEFYSMSLSAKIAFCIGCFFLGLAFVCVVVGGPLYIQEHYKVKFYVKRSCQVQSASYEIINSCLGADTKGMRNRKCYAAVWEVQLDGNATLKQTIKSDAEKSYKTAETKSEQYKVGSSYPCWYNTEKPSQLTWYKPTAFAAIILFIIGGVSIPLGIISMIVFCRLRQRPDL